MKKFTKYMSLGVASVMGLGLLASCDNTKDNDSFTMAPAANVPIYFMAQQTQTIDLGESDTEYIYNVYRNSTSAPATAALSWSGDTQYFFDLPSSVTFEEDALMAEIIFGVDPTSMEAKTPYTLTVTLPDYESTTVTHNYLENIFQYLPFSEWAPFGYDEAEGRFGIGTYNFSNYYSGAEYPVFVEYRYSLVDEDEIQYRFQWMIDYEDPSLGFETFLTATSSDGGETIRVPEQVFAYNSNYGDVFVSDMYYYTGDSSYNDSYFDDVTGTFYLDIIAYVADGYFGYGYETCVLDGYLDTNDYTVTLKDQGTITIDMVNYQIVNFSWTDYVSLVQYTVVDTKSIMEDDEVSEELVEELVENIASGKVTSSPAEDQGNYSFSFTESGNYTVVAVAFKEELDGSYSQKSYATLSFDFDNGDPNAGWESLGYVEYTDGYICSAYLVPAATYYVELQKSEDYVEFYRLVDPYAEAFPYNEPGDWNTKFHGYLYFDLFDPNFIYIDYSEQNLNWGDGYMVCFSLALNEYLGGATEEEVYDMGLTGSFEDDKLTFPYQSLMWSMDSGSTWMYGNREIDLDYYEQTGQVVPVTDENGDPVAPFCVDFNTLTDDPLAAAASASTRAAVSKSMRKIASNNNNANAFVKKHAKVVKFKSEKMKVGKRTPYRTSPSNAPLR